MELVLAIGVGVFACWLLAHVITTGIVIAKASPSKLKELRHLQGSASSVLKGQLENPPKTCDYRVVQGLEWDGAKYVPQSRLSTEALRAAFFQ